MGQTLGYHIVKTGYALWLPGDERGSWSEAWDQQIGYTEPHMLHSADPVRNRMAKERTKHSPVYFDPAMLLILSRTIAQCCMQSPWQIAAASMEPTHMHLLITYSSMDIHKTCKWLADQTAKVIGRLTRHAGPVWAKGKWCSYIFDSTYWNSTIVYIEAHNKRRGVAPRPYDFVTPDLFL